MRMGMGLTGLVVLTCVATAINMPCAQAADVCTENAPVSNEQAATVFEIASAKLGVAAVQPFTQYPSGAHADATEFTRTSVYSWTSGFFPAQLWLMYRNASSSSERARWLEWARAATDGLSVLANYTGTHDLGFMAGLPLGLASELDPNPARRATYDAVRTAAGVGLSQRWNEAVGAFTSGDYEGEWGTIIDSAVNAAFLIDAGQAKGGDLGRTMVDRGERHLDTLIEHFVRPDGSTRHRLKFNRTTGELIGATAGQGLGPDSTWTRGQAWAIYGFARAYALTGHERFLAAATAAADYWLEHVPSTCVPKWDLDDNARDAPLDSSAAAIAALGFDSIISAQPNHPQASDYRAVAASTLGVLAGPDWVQPHSTNPGILQRQSHAVPTRRIEGSYAWGDAYLLLQLGTMLPWQPEPDEAPAATNPATIPAQPPTRWIRISSKKRTRLQLKRAKVTLIGRTSEPSAAVKIYRVNKNGQTARLARSVTSNSHRWRATRVATQAARTTYFIARTEGATSAIHIVRMR